MLISIIVPIYNAEKYLHNCIQSVINQSYLHWKLILVNDGSTDASLEICQDFAKKDSRIVFFSQTNKGQAAARNFGVSQVTTPYVTFLDADDAISSDTLSSNMEILVNNTTIDCLQYPIYWSYETYDQHKTIQKQELISDNFYKNWLIKKKISWIVCNKIFKTTIFNHLSFKEGIVYEDNLFVAGMLSFINSIFISDKGLYYYYSRPSSTTTSKLSQKKEEDSYFVTVEIAKILHIKEEKHLLLDFLVRAINIKKSLKMNFNKKVYIPKQLLCDNSFKEILLSRLTMKDKLKLILEKKLF